MKEYGNAWIMIAFDPVNKVVMTFVVGKRSQKDADLLIKTVRERTDSNIPYFTSEGFDLVPISRALNSYVNIFNIYGRFWTNSSSI